MPANMEADGEKGVYACIYLKKHLDTHLHSHKQTESDKTHQ